MKTVSYTQARNNLAKEMERVVNDCDVTIITRANHESAVLISLKEYESWRETEYLLATPKNAARLRESWAGRGVGNPEIIEQFSWPYFMHFPGPEIRQGYIQELFEYQGRNMTWYAGASACFESVNHVVNYNHALIDEYL